MPGPAELREPPPAPNHRYTVEEYLRFERASQTKHEYYAGNIYATAGVGERHVLLVTNLIGELRPALKSRPCELYASQMRLKVTATGLFTYPDVIVVRGDAVTEGEDDILLNPQVIAEVLWPPTEAYDQGVKFEHYRTIATLTDYLLISSDARRVERRSRQPDGSWSAVTAVGSETVAIGSLGCELRLDDLYDSIRLPTQTAGGGV